MPIYDEIKLPAYMQACGEDACREVTEKKKKKGDYEMLKQTAFLFILFLSVFAAQVSAQTAYTIPDDLTPVSK